MFITLFESLHIARLLKCDNIRVNPEDRFRFSIDFYYDVTVLTYSIDKVGRVYCRIKTKNNFFLVDDLLIANDYCEWINTMTKKKNDNEYTRLIQNLYKFVELCIDVLYLEFVSTLINEYKTHAIKPV